jgi:hypothetical protein
LVWENTDDVAGYEREERESRRERLAAEPAFFQRGWMVLISGGHSHTPADIKDVSAGGEIFTHTGTVRISGDGKRPSPGLLIVLETTTTDDQYQREQAVRNAVRRADKIITSLTFIPSH